jgi:hypothetical protein
MRIPEGVITINKLAELPAIVKKFED